MSWKELSMDEIAAEKRRAEKYLWSRDSWGSAELPENADEIISKANEKISDYVYEKGLDEYLDGDEIRVYSEKLWEQYCSTGSI